jgi:diguanylate cyclase (GGDEF)-like protein
MVHGHSLLVLVISVLAMSLMILRERLMVLIRRGRTALVRQDLERLAQFDMLTALPNRTRFIAKLGKALSIADRAGPGFAVICLDLNGFKSVNDLFGHEAGNDILRRAATRIRGTIRDTDLLARLGGDEFGIVQELATQPQAANALAERLIEAFALPFEIDQQPITLGISLGLALAPQDGAEPAQLLRNAEMSLHRAKHAGPGTACYFAPELEIILRERKKMEADLRLALTSDQFYLDYQPVFDAGCNRQAPMPVGFEALLRWKHPIRGRVAPMDFIPLAEELGLILPLGQQVLYMACAEAATWHHPWRVAVNISAVQFKQKNLVAMVSECLVSTGLDPRRLELELTEAVLIENAALALDNLRALKALGISIVLDDFGTGYSSLGYLHEYPFDRLKIDRSFVTGLGQNHHSDAIVSSILALCRELRLAVTAEGVETELQLNLLRAKSCDQIQGFLLGRPGKVSVFAEAVAETIH